MFEKKGWLKEQKGTFVIFGKNLIGTKKNANQGYSHQRRPSKTHSTITCSKRGEGGTFHEVRGIPQEGWEE